MKDDLVMLRIMASFVSGCAMIGIVMLCLSVKEIVMGDPEKVVIPLIIFAGGAIAGAVGIHFGLKKADQNAAKLLEEALAKLDMDEKKR